MKIAELSCHKRFILLDCVSGPGSVYYRGFYLDTISIPSAKQCERLA